MAVQVPAVISAIKAGHAAYKNIKKMRKLDKIKKKKDGKVGKNVLTPKKTMNSLEKLATRHRLKKIRKTQPKNEANNRTAVETFGRTGLKRGGKSKPFPKKKQTDLKDLEKKAKDAAWHKQMQDFKEWSKTALAEAKKANATKMVKKYKPKKTFKYPKARDTAKEQAELRKNLVRVDPKTKKVIGKVDQKFKYPKARDKAKEQAELRKNLVRVDPKTKKVIGRVDDTKAKKVNKYKKKKK